MGERRARGMPSTGDMDSDMGSIYQAPALGQAPSKVSPCLAREYVDLGHQRGLEGRHTGDW